jgi:hypothetical protein
MGYERDEAMRVQAATEEMIRMRTPEPKPYRHVDEIARLRALNAELVEALVEFADAFDHIPLTGDFERRRAARVKAIAVIAEHAKAKE